MIALALNLLYLYQSSMLIALALHLLVSQLNADCFGSALTCITHMTAISTHNASVHIVALAELAGSCLL